MEKVLPSLGAPEFNCVSCGVYAQQKWIYLTAGEDRRGFGLQFEDDRFVLSHCQHCLFPTIWHGEVLIYPLKSQAPPANQDLPADVVRDYEEAAVICAASPRGAAALLRLAIQKLCSHLGQPGKNINADIKGLVAAGLPPKVQQALDTVRVIGNDAVHPGQIDLRDDRETVGILFMLVNFIAEQMISRPKEIDAIYEKLPESKRDAILNRDSNS